LPKSGACWILAGVGSWGRRFAFGLLLAGPACGGSSPSREAAFSPSAQPPEALADGWPVATLEAEGIDLARIEGLAERIERGQAGRVRSLLIARHGRLAFERYWYGGGREVLHELQSVTKSVTSALVGIAIDRGAIAGPEEPIERYFPGYAAAFRVDPAKGGLRLRHLLTMTAGLRWDERSTPFDDPRNSIGRMNASPDWVGYVLDQPVAEPPGTRFNYTSGCSILLGEILRQATGQDAARFAEEALFSPLGISAYSWYRHPTHPDHPPHTGGGLALRARDLAKLGQLYLDGGEWTGRPVVSEEWVGESTRVWIPADPGSHYGFQWWLHALAASGAPNDLVHGWGYRGQHLFVAPRLDLVVVMNGQNEQDDPGLRLFHDEVVPAVRP